MGSGSLGLKRARFFSGGELEFTSLQKVSSVPRLQSEMHSLVANFFGHGRKISRATECCRVNTRYVERWTQNARGLLRFVRKDEAADLKQTLHDFV